VAGAFNAALLEHALAALATQRFRQGRFRLRRGAAAACAGVHNVDSGELIVALQRSGQPPVDLRGVAVLGADDDSGAPPVLSPAPPGRATRAAGAVSPAMRARQPVAAAVCVAGGARNPAVGRNRP
jgi:hypothetical protein